MHPTTSLTTPELSPLQPWNWKRLLRWVGLLLLLFILAYEWAMHQPWGHPKAGVRLEPLHLYSRAEVKPGSFYELLEKAAQEMTLHPLTEDAKAQLRLFTKPTPPAWRSAELLPLAQAINDQVKALDLLQLASEQPLEQSFVLSDRAPDFLTTILQLGQLLRAQAQRNLADHQIDAAIASVRVALRLGDRFSQGGQLLDSGIARYFTIQGHQLARLIAGETKTEEELTRMEEILHQEGRSHQPCAETLRYELHSMTVNRGRDSISNEEDERALIMLSEGRISQRLLRLAPILGSNREQRQNNLHFIYTEVVAALEQDPSHADLDAIFEHYLLRKRDWRLYLKSDPVTRLYLPFLASVITQNHAGETELEASRRVTLAVIALWRYHQKQGRWPATLAEAMAEVPLDPFTRDQQPLSYELKAGVWVIHTSGLSVSAMGS